MSCGSYSKDEYGLLGATWFSCV
uniref:Uncharacterized protein n=1 Tax=Arundo donax TaxID=35708 RepID=A0A0A9FDZ0_ARUDO